MRRDLMRFALVAAVVILAQGAGIARATTIQDLIRLKGHQRNVLTGMGIVVGLPGTGDKSKDSLVAARPYAELLRNLGNPVDGVEELAKADAYAIVQVTMEIPPMGAREGDRFDVSVEAMYNASALAGGRLVVSMLRLPGPDAPDAPIYAFAEGPLVIEGDNVRSGTVRHGGQMLRDIRNTVVTGYGTMGLVLKDQYSGYPVATMIARAINDEFIIGGGHDIAVVEDAKNIKVLIPAGDRPAPAQFIATLMTIPVDPSMIQTEARIVINEREGIIVVTGSVEIGPVAITHKGLSISSITPPPGAQGAAVGGLERWTTMDTTDRQSRNSTRVDELLDAFKQLSVPVEDQVSIIYALKRTGQLHAEIVHE